MNGAIQRGKSLENDGSYHEELITDDEPIKVGLTD